MHIQVLEYDAEIVKGSYGYYCEFGNPMLHQDHWKVTGLIGKHYNILYDPNNLNSCINWKYLFIKTDFKEVDYYLCRFPEFKSIKDLIKFVYLLNNHFIIDTNFIDIKVLLDSTID